MQRCYVVQDSIYTRESKSKAQEFATKFELKEKELLLAKSHACLLYTSPENNLNENEGNE